MSYIDRSIAESKMHNVTLTEGNYDGYPEVILLDNTLKLKKTITIQKYTANPNVLIWNHPVQGKWNQFKWGPLSGTTEDVETIVQTNYNMNGFHTMSEAFKNTCGYLAYGTGEVSDDSTSLVSEVGRVSLSEVYSEIDNYFELKFVIDKSTSNGNIIKEWGLATASTGNISSTDTYAPIEKNNKVYITIYVRTTWDNL